MPRKKATKSPAASGQEKTKKETAETRIVRLETQFSTLVKANPSLVLAGPNISGAAGEQGGKSEEQLLPGDSEYFRVLRGEGG